MRLSFSSISLIIQCALLVCLFALPRTSALLVPLWMVTAILPALWWRGLLVPATSRVCLWIAVCIPAICAFILPVNLSEDVWRFLWDAGVIWQGEHPGTYTPVQWLGQQPAESAFYKLFPLLNSPNYHTVYPPFHLVGAVVAWPAFAHGSTTLSVLLVKLPLLCLHLFFARWLWVHRNPLFWLWVWHPLVLVEGLQNAHHDAAMSGLLLVGLLMTNSLRGHTSMTTALLVKLQAALVVPLLFLQGYISQRNLLVWLCAGIALAFWYLGGLKGGGSMLQGLELYFTRFEFNASIYFVARGVGQALVGYNPIAWVAPGLAILAAGGIVAISASKRLTPVLVLALCWAVYLFFSTTVHPWYVIPVLLFGAYSGWNFAVVWASLVPLSYLFYRDVDLWPWVTFVQYIPVVVVAWCDLRAWRGGHVLA